MYKIFIRCCFSERTDDGFIETNYNIEEYDGVSYRTKRQAERVFNKMFYKFRKDSFIDKI